MRRGVLVIVDQSQLRILDRVWIYPLQDQVAGVDRNLDAGNQLWAAEWNGAPPFDRCAEPILHYLVSNGFIDGTATCWSSARQLVPHSRLWFHPGDRRLG
jgi:hypothetical protein